jgi:hypothetical protein
MKSCDIPYCTLLSSDFFTHPVPFLPYRGMIFLFTARLALPVVRALMDRLIDGLRIPNFMTNHFDFFCQDRSNVLRFKVYSRSFLASLL